jgi:prepilin peptidase CpaA
MIGDWSLQQFVFAAVVGTFSLLAACRDFRTHRVPNWLTVPMFLAGWAFQYAFAGWDGVAEAAIAFGLGFGTLLIVWLMGSSGGGDVKLIGALSVWMGLRMTVLVLVVSTVLVLVGTVLLALGRLPGRIFARAASPAADSDDPPPARDPNARPRRRVMAYAIPVAFATWAVMALELPPM